ncbi:MAG: MBL fold metallo-hydrolase [Chitinophagaceae bacterium]
MKLYSIETGRFKLDGGAMFGVVPKSIWQKFHPADENNMCTWSMRCLLIEEGNRLILIDTGIGEKQDERFFSHYYLEKDQTLEKSLRTYGFHPHDITDVFLTHLHFDHCGGSVERKGDQLVPAFPRATYWSNELHWNWATLPNEREKASFLRENIFPIQQSGQLKFIPVEEGIAFFDQMAIRFVDGHTKAMMLPQITYKGQTLIYCADLFPSIGHLPIPYVMAYDMFPLTTLQEKKVFLEEALLNNYILFFEHDPAIECCQLEKTDRGIRAAEKFKLKDW